MRSRAWGSLDLSPALGIFITGFSSILTGLNFIVTIHRMRAPGMTWFRMPLFLWSIYATSLISVCMILASGLSFLGLGTKPPQPEWGLMLNTLRTAIFQNPWVAALPGLMIFAVSICFNLLSDGVRQAMDVTR